jgi:tetratricopeptide (TPR) repeat protein
MDDAALAQSSFEASAALARALGDRERLSFALNALAGHHAEAGDFARAEALCEEAVELGRELGDQDSLAIVLPNLARLVVHRGNAARAAVLLAEALAIARAIGSMRGGQNVIDVAAGLAVLRGEWSRAARFFGAVEALMTELSMRRTPEDETLLDQQMAKARAALGAEFTSVRDEGAALSYEAALAEVGSWLDAQALQPANAAR